MCKAHSVLSTACKTKLSTHSEESVWLCMPGFENKGVLSADTSLTIGTQDVFQEQQRAWVTSAAYLWKWARVCKAIFTPDHKSPTVPSDLFVLSCWTMASLCSQRQRRYLKVIPGNTFSQRPHSATRAVSPSGYKLVLLCNCLDLLPLMKSIPVFAVLQQCNYFLFLRATLHYSPTVRRRDEKEEPDVL